VTAKEPVVLVQQVFRKELKIINIDDCTEFVKEKNDQKIVNLS